MQNPVPMDISYEDRDFKVGSDRIGFVRKVFSIVAFQLLTTAFVTAIVISSESITDLVQSHPEINLITAIIALIIGITLICFRSISRQVPHNYVLLGIFTLCESYGVAGFSSLFEPSDVIMAAFGAGFITLILTAVAYYSDDLEFFRFAGFAILGLIMLTFMQLLFAFGSYNGWISLGLVFYCFYLVYDVKVIATDGPYGISLDDYIVGAIMIYLDVIIIFMRLLILIGKLKGK